ncbi:MAG: lysophospholipid acyltransferase family protein [candidate division Zixibacteria bacterium]
MTFMYRFGKFLNRLLSSQLFGIRIYGNENAPQDRSFILACNHISYFDPSLVGSWIKPEVIFFAKAELFKNPFMAKVMHQVNARPVRRGTVDRRALKVVFEALDSGLVLVIFPEGTRAREGHLLKPKPGVGLMARKADCPILPVYIHGTDQLKNALLRRVQMSITYGEPITADWIQSLPDGKDTYQVIAERVMEEIAALKDSHHTQ